MSKMNDKHRDKREKLSELRVEQLENLLTIGGKLPEDERSNAFYDAVEAAILAKEAAQPGGRIADVDDAWQQLLQKPAAPAMQALVGAGKKPRLRSAHRLVSAAALIAVMITLLVSIAVLAMDFSDVDAPKIVATWDDAFFRFSGEGKTLADYEEYPYEAGDSFAEPLREILYAYKFAVSVDPALLPAGTTMEGLETHLDPKAKLEYAFANCTFILPDGEEV
ncbi:MAG: hypothetical protein LBM28_01330, partial [Oscillospiraceae bacterium]|nr:hypothetical protein [Oscillospiraceae bacterium]